MTIILIIIYLIDFVAIGLKIESIIDINWLWILSPYWAPFLVYLAVIIIKNLEYLWDEWEYRYRSKRHKD